MYTGDDDNSDVLVQKDFNSQDIQTEIILARARKKRALELRIAGMTYLQIYEVISREWKEKGLTLPQSYTRRRAAEDVMDMLREDRREREVLTSDIVELELNRLDDLFKVAYNSSMRGNLKAITSCLRILDMRAKLLGVYAPKTVQVRDWKYEILEMIIKGKVTWEQVKEELGEELTGQLLESGGRRLLEGGTPESGVIEDAEFTEVARTPSGE